LAFVLHLAVTLMIGVFAVSFIYRGAGWASVLVVVIGFALMAASLVFLTWLAVRNHWQPDDDLSRNAPLPSPRAAWGNAQSRERVLWVLFVIAFFAGLALNATKSIVGVGLVVLSLLLAIVAMRVRK